MNSLVGRGDVLIDEIPREVMDEALLGRWGVEGGTPRVGVKEVTSRGWRGAPRASSDNILALAYAWTGAI